MKKFYYFVLAVVILAGVFIVQQGSKRWCYEVQYKALVRQTIQETVKPEALK